MAMEVMANHRTAVSFRVEMLRRTPAMIDRHASRAPPSSHEPQRLQDLMP